jgi:hypothetical protein
VGTRTVVLGDQDAAGHEVVDQGEYVGAFRRRDQRAELRSRRAMERGPNDRAHHVRRAGARDADLHPTSLENDAVRQLAQLDR